MDELNKNGEMQSNSKKERGATMLEYGVMVALILAVCVGVVKVLGTTLNSTFSRVNSTMN